MYHFIRPKLDLQRYIVPNNQGSNTESHVHISKWILINMCFEKCWNIRVLLRVGDYFVQNRQGMQILI